jgi:hypothetical protein
MQQKAVYVQKGVVKSVLHTSPFFVQNMVALKIVISAILFYYLRLPYDRLSLFKTIRVIGLMKVKYSLLCQINITNSYHRKKKSFGWQMHSRKIGRILL